MRTFSTLEKKVIDRLTDFKGSSAVAQFDIIINDILEHNDIKIRKNSGSYFCQSNNVWKPIFLCEIIEVCQTLDYLDNNNYIKICGAGTRISNPVINELESDGPASFTKAYPIGSATYEYFEQYWDKAIFVSQSLLDLKNYGYKSNEQRYFEDQIQITYKQLKYAKYTLVATVLVQILTIIIQICFY